MTIHSLKQATLATALLFACGAAGAQDQPDTRKSAERKFSAGVNFTDKASADDTGLPLYPGATPHRDRKRDGDGVNLGFWGGSFGLKVVAVKLQTPDSPATVAAFYRQAMSSYGEVLDCSKRQPSTDAEPRRRARGDPPRPLSCHRDTAEKRGLLYKVGTRDSHRIVSIQPDGQGAVFQLVFIEMRGTD